MPSRLESTASGEVLAVELDQVADRSYSFRHPFAFEPPSRSHFASLDVKLVFFLVILVSKRGLPFATFLLVLARSLLHVLFASSLEGLDTQFWCCSGLFVFDLSETVVAVLLAHWYSETSH